VTRRGGTVLKGEGNRETAVPIESGGREGARAARVASGSEQCVE